MSTDQILEDMIVAQEAFERAADAYAEATRVRDEAVARARRTGTTVTRLGELLGMSRQNVHKILARRQ